MRGQNKELSDKGVRAANFIIDFICIAIFALILWAIFFKTGEKVSWGLWIALATILYYFSLEAATGRTLGKILTRTKVVDLNGHPPGPEKIFFRTILRLNPLDWYSYAFGSAVGSHDLLSRTRVVRMGEIEDGD